MKLPPLSLYIHIPWCIRKCPYCDFNSHQIKTALPEQEYITALLLDLKQNFPKNRNINSIFIGGGTPSVLSNEAISELLSKIKTYLLINKTAEITMEVNPGTADKLQGFNTAGINRLSLGIQSFNDIFLQNLGRIHGCIESIQAIKTAQQIGFNNINLDLMFGLPGQTVTDALKDLQIAISHQPSHISWYQLTIEPNTYFYNKMPKFLPDDELLWEIQIAGQKYLAAQGYKQYEVSAYAKSGYQCQHNFNYWKFGDYLGIGAGAHSKITNDNGITRFSKPSHPNTYLQSTAKIELKTLTNEDIILEFMMNALRLLEGFTEAEFTNNTGLDMSYIKKPLQQALKKGWLQQNNQHISTTETGMRFLNCVLEMFMLD
ncbi:radical SAM family heme chaperone HemW [Candidatus Halobeggiatoa sp. HSG11]|nr:radical SAM family heme chaperone HemW [Candidatus Halobeggiatoa sp. HSG11]